MDFYGNRHDETYIFRRVTWKGWEEHEPYPYITGGSIEFAEDASLKVSGSFDFDGLEMPKTEDLLRVYYRFTDDSGETGTFPIATFFINFSDLKHVQTTKGLKSQGSLDANSVLRVLDDAEVGQPYIIPAGTRYITRAVELIQSFGLNVDYAPSSAASRYDQVFDPGTTYLEIVNWLVTQAGYTEIFPDAYGTVVVKTIDAIMADIPELILKTDKKSIIYPEIERQNDYLNTPNVVRYMHDTETSCIVATAKNMTGSKSSLDARGGREQTEFEEIGDMPRETGLLKTLMKMAEKRVRELATDIEYVEYAHAFVPMQLYQTMTLEFADLSWTGIIDNYTIDLSPGTKIQTKLKRETPQEIIVDVSGAVVRGTDDE